MGKNKSVRLTFLGDISLNGEYIGLYDQGLNPFESFDFSRTDLVVGNLECFVEGDCGENTKKNPRLKTKYETLNYLNKLSMNIVCLANNHAYDNLEDGFSKTISFLDNNHIEYMGAGFSREAAEKPIIKTIKGIRFLFLNYVTPDTNPCLPNTSALHLNWAEEDRILSDIAKHRAQVDQIVLLMHWGGGSEGLHYPEYYQIQLGRKLIDAGADLIIGHHAHVLQPFEIYRGKYIYYSLGNFCFSNFEFNGYVYKMGQFFSGYVKVDFFKDSYTGKLNYFSSVDSDFNGRAPLYFICLFGLRRVLFKFFKNHRALWRIFFKFNYIYTRHVKVAFDFIVDGDRTLKEKIDLITLKRIKVFIKKR